MTNKHNSNQGISGAVYQCLRDYFENHGENLPASGLYQTVMEEVERPLLELTLRAVNGNQKKASEILGINRNTLRKKMVELGLATK